MIGDGTCEECGLLLGNAAGRCYICHPLTAAGAAVPNVTWFWGSNKGWECPKCGRCYSPTTDMCLHCKPNNSFNWEGLRTTVG